MRTFRTFFFTLLISALAVGGLLPGCTLPGNFTLPVDFPSAGSATSAPTQPSDMLPAGGATPTNTSPAQPTQTPLNLNTATPALTLWVPPEFDPANGTPAGDLLAARLEEFSRQNGGVQVQVRIKSANGQGGLLESLSATSAAAPLVMPSVVALSRPDLESAAIKGLIYPLDGVSNVIDQPDWYQYARQLAMVQGATFALPFAGDVLVLAYRPSKVTAPPTDWTAIFRLGQPMAFTAGDNQSLFLLSLYQASGGAVEDAQRRPMLQADVLSQVLRLLADGEQRGVFPYWLSQYETSGQVWQAYRDGRVNALVTWVSNYLIYLPADTTAAPVPPIGEGNRALATGWGWAVADPIPERRALSVRLAEFLSEDKFLAEWTEAAGYLPTRPSALAAWSNQSLKTLLSPIAVSAEARPSVDQLASLGPVLKEAALRVLKREVDPAQAAQSAAERLQVPEPR